MNLPSTLPFRKRKSEYLTSNQFIPSSIPTKCYIKLTKQKHRGNRALNNTKLQKYVYPHGTGSSHIRQIMVLVMLICTWDGHHMHKKLMWPQCPRVYTEGAESRLLHLQVFLSLLNCILIVHFSFVQT